MTDEYKEVKNIDDYIFNLRLLNKEMNKGHPTLHQLFQEVLDVEDE